MDFSKLKQLDTETANKQAVDPNAVVSAIVIVKQANYVPEQVVVRKVIDKFMFTANVKVGDLNKLKQDSLVESFSVAQKLQGY